MAKKAWKGDVRESAHKIWLAGLGALAVAEDEGSKLFKTLVEQGERYEVQGKERLKEAKKGAEQATAGARKAAEETAERARRAAEEAWQQLGGAFDEKLAKALHRVGVPTRDEISALSRRIEELTRSVDRVRAKPAARPAAKPAAKPTVAPRPKPAKPRATVPVAVKSTPGSPAGGSSSSGSGDTKP
jgi:poly(hydroxyalkanoate) granule-associated protein